MKQFHNRIGDNSGGNTTAYRKLTRRERRILAKNGNTADDWNNLAVCEGFSASAVHGCGFYGKNRIGNHHEEFLSCKDLRLPVGITNSTIVSCDIGNDAAVHNVHYLAGYRIGNRVMLFNIDEMISPDTRTSEFDPEKSLTWIAVANENGGRRISSFAGMTTADAYLWSCNRGRSKFQENLLNMTVAAATEGDKDMPPAEAGGGCRIGDGAVLRSCRMIEGVEIGECARITGANALKKLTIRSSAAAPTVIGEGVGLEDGHIDSGCKVLSGVKAMRFCLGTNATLDNGARFIDSILGDNGKISCCEVVSSLLFPFVEMHHNNSFLMAATIQGQCNVGAGATIGSNHNSRAADSELFAGRGFWPGLCVNVKNPSRFASYCLLAKGSYYAELNIPIPFTLVSNDEKENKLQLYPGYWFLHNMYGLGRNSWKLPYRDTNLHEWQRYEYDYLAPDTVEELFAGLEILEKWINRYSNTDEIPPKRMYLEPDGIERSSRGVVVLNIQSGYETFKEIIHYYGIRTLLNYMHKERCESFPALESTLKTVKRQAWLNLGGQLFKEDDYQHIITSIENRAISTWAQVHRFYKQKAGEYPVEKARHALASLLSLHGVDLESLTEGKWKEWVESGVELQNQILSRTVMSRRKDYQHEFRRMMYESDADMIEVIGDPDDNPFIRSLERETEEFKKLAEAVVK